MTMTINRAAAILCSTALLSVGGHAAATSIVEIPTTQFTPAAGLITFGEFPQNTQNPVYLPATYGGGAGSPTVAFGGYFVGQSLGTASACAAGAALTGCVVGSPTGPLVLDPASPATFIAADSAQPTAPILSGSPLYNGPIAIEFSTPQEAVGLIGGYFNAIASTGITAYDANGNSLGTVTNTMTGDEFLGLETTDGSADISGILFHLVGAEPAGFDIDNIQFGVGAGQVAPVSGAPEPSAWALMMVGVGLVGLALRQTRRVTSSRVLSA